MWRCFKVDCLLEENVTMALLMERVVGAREGSEVSNIFVVWHLL